MVAVVDSGFCSGLLAESSPPVAPPEGSGGEEKEEEEEEEDDGCPSGEGASNIIIPKCQNCQKCKVRKVLENCPVKCHCCYNLMLNSMLMNNTS